jgi:PadR family transcriptional regulator PadR
MGGEPRITPSMAALLKVFLENPADSRYGLELVEKLGIKGGTIYPALARLERCGWLESKREMGDPSKLGRPRRKLYRLTAEGEAGAAAALDRWRGLLGLNHDAVPSFELTGAN